MFFYKLYIWIIKFFSSRKSEMYKLVEKQHKLLHSGFDTIAEIIKADVSEDKVGNQYKVELWIKITMKDGSLLYTHSNTLLSISQLPLRKSTLRIRYFPDDLSSIVILSACA